MKYISIFYVCMEMLLIFILIHYASSCLPGKDRQDLINTINITFSEEYDFNVPISYVVVIRLINNYNNEYVIIINNEISHIINYVCAFTSDGPIKIVSKGESSAIID